MTDSTLSREHSLALLHKLAHDDDFRGRYQADPAAALAQAGVPQAAIDGMHADSKAPMTLASKDAFATALDHYRQGVAELCLCQSAPQVNLSIGAPSGEASSTIPFAAA